MIADNTCYEHCPPRADAMIDSLRAIGYDLSMAVADLIDNSIFANAKHILINYGWEEGDPWIRIMDDGHGMTEERLKEAMRLGCQGPLDQRVPEDLGRFGFGMKTASFSQCSLVTVHTKTNSGEVSTRCWDMDQVRETKEWVLGKEAPDKAQKHLSPLKTMPHGTIVLWQNIDRVVDLSQPLDDQAQNVFFRKFLAVKQYLEMVFHRYLDAGRSRLFISVGEAKCEPWDPYLRSNQFTQELSNEKYEDNRVRITPFVLPHISKRTAEENMAGGGIYGWNAHQGFYVYRNKRMIVPGGYLDMDLKPEEHYKLARILVDITNDMDHEWRIDVKKAVASPPDYLRSEFNRIAKATRSEAMKVYRARLGEVRRTHGPRSDNAVWLKQRIGDKISYRINSKNPVLRKIALEINPEKSWLRRLFHVIETSVPHRLIIMDNAETEDCHVCLPPDKTVPMRSMLKLCEEFYRASLKEDRSHAESVDFVTAIEPFNTHPAYRAHLDGLEEGKSGDE